MVTMTPAEWHRIGDAILLWSGWGNASTPQRQWELLELRFGAEIVAKVRELAAEFHGSDARFTATTLMEMGDLASRQFAARYPALSSEALEALAWCYTFDYK